MSAESVAEFVAEHAPDIDIVELDEDSSTFTLSATWDIEPAQIAKTLVLKVRDRNVMVVTCGDSRLDNKKLKVVLGAKAKMLGPEETTELTGHTVGGVCPLGLAVPMPIYFDRRLRFYDEVVPGAGSPRRALRISPTRLADLVGADWADLCLDA